VDEQNGEHHFLEIFLHFVWVMNYLIAVNINFTVKQRTEAEIANYYW